MAWSTFTDIRVQIPCRGGGNDISLSLECDLLPVYIQTTVITRCLRAAATNQ
ncbi:unnamed protein product [Lupinus luteus]|uniref:Uncharacterized protein n=1 Tax=Lupinus luteus TaxID=3873 RepID=A0AAV1YML9_LUPLU